MSKTGFEDGPTKPQLKLDGNKIIAENIGVYGGSIPTSYRKETIYHFKDEEAAKEFYYKKK